ncbi:hypothetical protein TIFTF001_051265 [Ficus carica]|uniref:Uncharacterized protein n=1 Tax=Ficus carica TaxID=3494 RepID=A0AA87Z7B8_FICCA|nr:hypothetical protein TIFTF001_051234 [Ficus carica]GMN22701.1 hypothetical protein TIFTF001_051237 [Ficus carica]GMN22892.1 hypothetical protein TIFTF001_051262 [Ficus carica]GMN22906.1 hypothetical protein TIFTF001_051265 [Ficus carica]
MGPVAIAFIVMGSVVAGVIILHILYGRGSKKNKTTNPQPSHRADLERGEGNKTTSGDKDGGLAILEGTSAVLEITDSVVKGGGGGGGGGDGGGGDGCCFGGCGGSCGGCGGCGG